MTAALHRSLQGSSRSQAFTLWLLSSCTREIVSGMNVFDVVQGSSCTQFPLFTRRHFITTIIQTKRLWSLPFNKHINERVSEPMPSRNSLTSHYALDQTTKVEHKQASFHRPYKDCPSALFHFRAESIITLRNHFRVKRTADCGLWVYISQHFLPDRERNDTWKGGNPRTNTTAGRGSNKVTLMGLLADKKRLIGCSNLVQTRTQSAKGAELRQQTFNVQNCHTGSLRASRVFAFFADSLGLLLMGTSGVKDSHHLTEKATLQKDKQCRFIFLLLHRGHRWHCLPAAFLCFLQPFLDRLGFGGGDGWGATCCRPWAECYCWGNPAEHGSCFLENWWVRDSNTRPAGNCWTLPAAFQGDLRGGNDGMRSEQLLSGRGSEAREVRRVSIPVDWHSAQADKRSESPWPGQCWCRQPRWLECSFPSYSGRQEQSQTLLPLFLPAPCWKPTAQHNTNNTASSNGVYGDAIGFINTDWATECCQQETLNRWNITWRLKANIRLWQTTGLKKKWGHRCFCQWT